MVLVPAGILPAGPQPRTPVIVVLLHSSTGTEARSLRALIVDAITVEMEGRDIDAVPADGSFTEDSEVVSIAEGRKADFAVSGTYALAGGSVELHFMWFDLHEKKTFPEASLSAPLDLMFDSVVSDFVGQMLDEHQERLTSLPALPQPESPAPQPAPSPEPAPPPVPAVPAGQTTEAPPLTAPQEHVVPPLDAPVRPAPEGLAPVLFDRQRALHSRLQGKRLYSGCWSVILRRRRIPFPFRSRTPGNCRSERAALLPCTEGIGGRCPCGSCRRRGRLSHSHRVTHGFFAESRGGAVDLRSDARRQWKFGRRGTFSFCWNGIDGELFTASGRVRAARLHRDHGA